VRKLAVRCPINDFLSIARPPFRKCLTHYASCLMLSKSANRPVGWAAAGLACALQCEPLGQETEGSLLCPWRTGPGFVSAMHRHVGTGT
jgi:hypothetical protein